MGKPLLTSRSWRAFCGLGLILHLIFLLPRLPSAFNRFSPPPESINQLNNRRLRYPFGIGRFFENKITYSLSVFTRDWFNTLDPGRYFFASHPRETWDIGQLPFLPWWLAIFIIPIIVFYFSRIWHWWLGISLLVAVFGSGELNAAYLMIWPLLATLYV